MNSSHTQIEWSLLAPDEEIVRRLTRKAGLGDSVARLLVNRGIHDEAEARKFLNPDMKHLPDFSLLPQIGEATDRIMKAISEGENIIVYGDYDADGVTATSLLVLLLERLGAAVSPYQPHRVDEGYGLNTDALDKLRDEGADLIVTVDLGIADAEAVEHANAIGLDVIIVDHHQVPEKIPNAVAVIDPLLSEEAEQFHLLSGVGLAYFLGRSLFSASRKNNITKTALNKEMYCYLDLVALGTIADMMPLMGVNRILVGEGLKELGAEKRPGIAALKAKARLDRKSITAGQVAFQLGPRLNAAGRMAEASVAVDLLTTSDPAKARKLATELDRHNQDRQGIEKEIVKEAIDLIAANGYDNAPALVLYGENWNSGVLGIVASRLVDKYAVPVAVISRVGDECKGSVRSVAGVNAWRALDECSSCLVSFGGHEMAGGLNIKMEHIDGFREKFVESVQRQNVQPGQRKLKIDMEIDFGDVERELVDSIRDLAPHGIGNPEPLFLVREMKCESARKVGVNHLKFRVNHGANSIDAIAFGQADKARDLAGPVDLVFTPILSRWGGFERVEIKVKGIRPSNGA